MPANKYSDKYPGEKYIVEDFWVGSLTNIIVTKTKTSHTSTLFPVLYMSPYSNMTFDVSWTKVFTVKYRDAFDVHATSILDFTKI